MVFHPHRHLVVRVMQLVPNYLKEWVDDVFIAAARFCQVDPGLSLVYSHLRGRRHHGRLPRSCGIFQKLKCSTMSKFILYLDSLDWHRKGVGTGTRRSGGTFYTISGIEGQMMVALQAVGPFQ